MYVKSQVDLIYQGLGVEEDGSPINLEICKTVRCDEMQTFSVNYYNSQQRNMRTSRNLVVATHFTEDIYKDDIKYELMYCIYDCVKYRVKNVLKYKRSQKVGFTRQLMILDIDEIR